MNPGAVGAFTLVNVRLGLGQNAKGFCPRLVGMGDAQQGSADLRNQFRLVVYQYQASMAGFRGLSVLGVCQKREIGILGIFQGGRSCE
jgi:hypothetical protein